MPSAEDTSIAVGVEDLYKHFDGVKAVDGLTFEVTQGEIFGLLGPNGAGKTTTIRVVMDILKPDSGEVTVLGQPPGEARRQVGYLPEERGLYRDLRVLDALVYLAELKGLARALAVENSERWLERIELSDWAQRKVKDLSRGMRQKLQFIASVVHDPDLVILDEPFQALDPVNVDLINTLIRQLRETGTTVLLSTHQMNMVEALCDRIVLIDHGQTALYGALREIKQRFAPNTVMVRTSSPLPDLPHVVQIESRDNAYMLTLGQEGTPQELLQTLLEQGIRVEAFEVESAPLDQIFISVVGRADRG